MIRHLARSAAGVIYATTPSGVLRSIDGQMWTVESAGLAPFSQADAIDVPPDAPDEVWVGGYWLSTSADRGSTFSRVLTADGADGWNVSAVRVAGQVVVLGTEKRIQVSTDRGVSFTPRPFPVGDAKVHDILLVGPTKFLVATSVGAFYTTDLGASLTSIPGPTSVFALDQLPGGALIMPISTSVHSSAAPPAAARTTR